MPQGPSFSDEFSKQADAYARHRPTYPPDLIEFVASLSPGRRLAWDCGTGNGQVALPLAGRFETVYASDASRSQIQNARPHPRVQYAVERAEDCSLPDGSADLVVCAQSLHWLDIEAFYAQVQRVLRPGGVLAVWGYGGLRTDSPRLSRLIDRFMRRTMLPYWAPQVQLIWRGYRTIPFPFEPIQAPNFVMEVDWAQETFVGYLRSWSSVQRFKDDQGRDPLIELQEPLRGAWGDATHRRITWDLALRAGRTIAARTVKR